MDARDRQNVRKILADLQSMVAIAKSIEAREEAEGWLRQARAHLDQVRERTYGGDWLDGSHERMARYCLNKARELLEEAVQRERSTNTFRGER